MPCQDGTWCCSAADGDGIGDTSCCKHADQTFRLDFGALLLSAQQHRQPFDKTTPEDHTDAQRLIQRDDEDSSTTTTTSTSSLATSGIPLTAEEDDDDDDSKERDCPPDRSYIVGLSAGVPLGVCLLAALAAIFVLLNRDRKARERIRQMTEAAREERERAAQEHMIPRIYGASSAAGSSSAYNPSVKPRFSHGSTVVMAGPAPLPQTPQGQQGGYEGYEGYEMYDGGYADGVGVLFTGAAFLGVWGRKELGRGGMSVGRRVMLAVVVRVVGVLGHGGRMCRGRPQGGRAARGPMNTMGRQGQEKRGLR